jgi:hypothetical protein
MTCRKCVIGIMFLGALCFAGSSASAEEKKGFIPYWAKFCRDPNTGQPYKKYKACGPDGSGYYCDGNYNCCTSPNMLPSCQPPPPGNSR